MHSSTATEMTETVGQGPSFAEIVCERRSFREFEPVPVPATTIERVLRDAQLAPSNCNTQPWNVHIVSGDARDALSGALLAANETGTTSMDFSWDEAAYDGRMGQRRREQGAIYYTSLGADRHDLEARAHAGARNFSFYDAPHVALLFMPVIGDNVRVAADLGMYAQNFLLSLTAHGLGGVPQTVLGFHAQTIRDTLGIPDDQKMLFGISFGRPRRDALANSERVGRDHIAANVTFHD